MKIENYCETSQNTVPKPYHLAEFSVSIPALGLTIHKFRLLRAKNGGYYFTAPQYFLPNPDDPNGKKLKYPFIEFTGERKADFEKKVMELLKEFVR